MYLRELAVGEVLEQGALADGAVADEYQPKLIIEDWLYHLTAGRNAGHGCVVVITSLYVYYTMHEILDDLSLARARACADPPLSESRASLFSFSPPSWPRILSAARTA